MRTWQRVGTVAVGAAVVAAGGGAVALAAFSPVDAQGQVHSCYSTKNGALRVVAPGSRCSGSELPLVWGQRGPAGPAGAAGPQGPAGALDCADELRILAAAPSFEVSPACAAPPPPDDGEDVALSGFDVASVTVAVGGVTEIGVLLTAPAAHDTVVSLTVLDGTVASVRGGVVPAGQSRGAVLVDGVAPGSTTLTAGLGGASDTIGVSVQQAG